jgi:hypothetical protein
LVRTPSTRAPRNEWSRLLVHRLHDGTYDAGKDRTTSCAAKRIGHKAAERPRRGRIGTRSTPKEATKKCTSSERSPEADIELNCVNVAKEHTGTLFLNRPSLLGMMVSLLLELGRDLSNPLRCEGLLLG